MGSDAVNWRVAWRRPFVSYDNAWLQECFETRLPAAGFAVREEQLAMANYVQTALKSGRHLLAEAGVGTGKTFAYLLPALGKAIRTQRPVIVATHTIALQEQLVNKDIPALRKVLGEPIQAHLAKGREHYMCPKREIAWRERTPEPDAEGLKLAEWARRTRSGDRAEVPGLSEALWSRVNLDERHRCGGCRYEFTCPTAGTRRKWLKAWGFIVTNHHQFFADMALRASGRHLFALPGAVVLDEAHAVPDTAREILGHRMAIGGFRAAVEHAARQLPTGDRSAAPVLQRVDAFTQLLPTRVRWSAGEEAERFDIATDHALAEATTALSLGLQRLEGRLAGMGNAPERLAARQRLTDAMGALLGILDLEAHISWAEGAKGKRGVTAIANAPRRLDAILETHLFGRGTPVVLTSATLSVAEDFGYVKHELGLDRLAEKPLACSVGSPFDYARQARIYIADDLPDPGADADAFYQAALARLEALITAVDGRVLVLYTAKTRSKEAHRHLSAWGRVPVYHQDRGDATLVEKFRAEPRAVLVGTGYWQGLDVPGLSAVVIVKLPFPAEDPLLAAELKDAKERGEEPFEAVLLPKMLLELKQGSGRLIRRDTDRGVIAILDPRAVSRSYAEQVTETLPEAPRVETLDAMREFLRTPVH
jgi:ATP-dependent DNA helicase DinG